MSVIDTINGLSDRLLGLLQGEPARVIGYGAAVIIYLVAAAFKAIPDVSFEQAIGDATAAITMLVSVVESIRHLVFSPNTVNTLLAEKIDPPVAPGDPIAQA